MHLIDQQESDQYCENINERYLISRRPFCSVFHEDKKQYQDIWTFFAEQSECYEGSTEVEACALFEVQTC